MKHVNTFECILSTSWELTLSVTVEVWNECELIFSSSQYSLTVNMSKTGAFWTPSLSLTAVNCSFTCGWKCVKLCVGAFSRQQRRATECYPLRVLAEINKTFNKYNKRGIQLQKIKQQRKKNWLSLHQIPGALCSTRVTDLKIWHPVSSMLTPNWEWQTCIYCVSWAKCEHQHATRSL